MAAFAVSFTVGQSSDGSAIIITDTSNYADNGTKSAFTNRQLFVYFVDNSQLVFPNQPSFSFADYPSDTISIPITRDFSFNIVLSVDKISPLTHYNKSEIVTLTVNTDLFKNSIIQKILAQPNIINDTLFFNSLSNLQVFEDGANDAGLYGQQYLAQVCLDLAYALNINQNDFF